MPSNLQLFSQIWSLAVRQNRCILITLSRAGLSTPMEDKVTGFEVFRLRLELNDCQPNARLKPATAQRNTEWPCRGQAEECHHKRLTYRQGTSRSWPTTVLELQGWTINTEWHYIQRSPSIHSSVHVQRSVLMWATTNMRVHTVPEPAVPWSQETCWTYTTLRHIGKMHSPIS